MKRHRTALLVACLLLTGCGSSPLLMRGNDALADRGERREEALQRFEQQRDGAQYLAAMERWKAGDPHTCSAQLRSLVGRNPQHLEARRALADLALENGDVATAEAELRSILQIAPQDAPTHHALGLLLDAAGRTAEAGTHLRRATELDPGNTLYQLCLQPSPPAPSAPSAPLAQSALPPESY